MSRTVSMQFGKPGVAVQNNGGSGGSGGSGFQFDLLWTNPSPDESFGAKTISGIDLSSYDMVAVEIRFSQADKYQMSLQLFFWSHPASRMQLSLVNNNNRCGTRAMTYNNEEKTITFAKGIYNSSDNNSYVVPQNIYGIKF